MIILEYVMVFEAASLEWRATECPTMRNINIECWYGMTLMLDNRQR